MASILLKEGRSTQGLASERSTMSSAYDLESQKQHQLDLDRGDDFEMNTQGPAGQKASASQSSDIHQYLQAKKGGAQEKEKEIVKRASARINASGSYIKVYVHGKSGNEPFTLFAHGDFLLDSWESDLKRRLKHSVNGYGFENPAQVYKDALSMAMKVAGDEVERKKDEWDPRRKESR